MKISGWIIAIVMTLSLGACQESLEVKPNTYSKLLTGEESKTWEIIGLQYRESGKPLQSIDAAGNNFCDLDDHFIFYASVERKFVIDEGASKCNDEDPQVLLEDSWALVNANASLEFVVPIFGFFKYPWIVQELTEDRLVTEIFFGEELELSWRVVFRAIDEN